MWNHVARGTIVASLLLAGFGASAAPTIRRMLTSRQELILCRVVDDYLRTGTPVASKSIAADPDLECAPSTVRNELALLEESAHQPTHELRLSRAQLAIQRDDLAANEFARQLRRDPFRLGHAVRDVRHPNVCSQPEETSGCNLPLRSMST